MSSSRPQSDTAGAFAFIVIAFVAWVVWQFKELTNLTWELSIEVLGYIALCTVSYGAARLAKVTVTIWPLYILGIYCSLFPAFDYWGGVSDELMLGYVIEKPWYTIWYVKMLISVAIVLAGYTLDSKRQELF